MLTYKLPSSASRLKVATWRQLRRTGALSLQNGVWAIAHGEDGSADLRVATGLIAEAGGTWSAAELARSDPGTAQRQQQLRQSCDELWNAFYNELDRVVGDLDPGAGLRGVGPSLDRLREIYLEARRKDLLDGEAARRARRRLTECYLMLDDDLPEGEPGRQWLRRACPSPSIVMPPDCWARTDGSNTYLARVQPTPPVGWERAFARFEAILYRPSPDRPPLEHGAFTFAAPAADCRPMLEGLAGRLHRFKLSLA